MRRVFLCVSLLLCAACASQPQNNVTPTPRSLWTEPITLAQTQQTDAPALVVNNGVVTAVWIGSDERGVHQDGRRLTAQGLTDVVTMPLPPTHPYGQQLFPGVNGNFQLLWLDAGTGDQTILYSALLTLDLSVARGPTSVSDGLALSYSAVSDGSGGLWTAWSGGQLSEMTVYVRRIDSQGRPLLQTTTIASNADDPALVRTTNGEVWLFWIADGQVMSQELSPQGSARALTGAVSLATGDRLIDVSAALDLSSAYFFWNITRDEGTNETWMASGSLDAGVWGQPQRLGINVAEATQVDTGFKLGNISAASPGTDTTLRWVEPVSGQYGTLVAAVESDAGLGIVALRGGAVVGYALAVPGVKLIGIPALMVETDNNFDLAWSSPGDSNANLLLTRTRG